MSRNSFSKEKRNFVRSPPPGANYHFDMAAVYPVALATLEVDENLKQMRFDLVPKQYEILLSRSSIDVNYLLLEFMKKISGVIISIVLV